MSAKPKKRVDVILSDVHGLFRDKRAVDAAFRTIAHVEPNRIILNGDMVDFPTVSKYDVDPERLSDWSVDKEAKSMFPFFQTVDEMSAEPVVYLMGNHEARWDNYFSYQAPRASKHHHKSIREVLSLPQRWETLRYKAIYRLGRLQVTHGAKPLASYAGGTAAGHQRKFGGNILVGHSHRLGFSPFTNGQGTFGAWENGHLSLPPHYAEATQNWQQGFSVVTTHANGEFVVELVPVVKGRAFFRGEII